MQIKLFYHSLYSDWNHGNAHFLRGIVSEMIAEGHDVEVYETVDNWSLQNLETDGKDYLTDFHSYYPTLRTSFYEPKSIDLERELTNADLVIVHEWNDPELIARIGNVRKNNDHFQLLFHDTHHRSVSRKEDMQKYDLRNFDGVLAFGNVISDIYRNENWTKNVWTWHEAADTNIFQPRDKKLKGDLVWIGNWGDNERTEELEEFLFRPVRELKLKATVYGVRYPQKAVEKLNEAGIEYGGYLPNYLVPQVFSEYKVTVHIPRKPYVEKLHGIPTIRPFEALACGIPMVSSPWNDTENLFRVGQDFRMAGSGEEMKEEIEHILNDESHANRLAENGLETIRKKHTCKIRLNELKQICNGRFATTDSNYNHYRYQF